MEFVREKVEELRKIINQQSFTREIFKAYSYVIEGYKNYPNLNRGSKKFDFEDSSLELDRRSLNIVNTVFPAIKELSLHVKQAEYARSLTRNLIGFQKLEALKIEMKMNLRFKGPLLKIKRLEIMGFLSNEQSIRSILEKVTKYSYLTLRECMMDNKMITILRYENIKYLQLHNIDSWDDKLYTKLIPFIKNSNLKVLEIVDTYKSTSKTQGKYIIKNYLENKFHEDLEEFTFSIINEHIDLTKFITLKKIKKNHNIFLYFYEPKYRSYNNSIIN